MWGWSTATAKICIFGDAPGGGKQFPDPITNTTHAGCRVAPLDYLSAAPGHQGVLDYYMSEEVALYSRQLSTPLTSDQLAALGLFFGLADGLPFPGQDVNLPDELGHARRMHDEPPLAIPRLYARVR